MLASWAKLYVCELYKVWTGKCNFRIKLHCPSFSSVCHTFRKRLICDFLNSWSNDLMNARWSLCAMSVRPSAPKKAKSLHIPFFLKVTFILSGCHVIAIRKHWASLYIFRYTSLIGLVPNAIPFDSSTSSPPNTITLPLPLLPQPAKIRNKWTRCHS